MADETVYMEKGGDPADYNVDQVNHYLSTLSGPEDEEYQRVLTAERDGKGRVGILGDQEDPETADTTTKGQTFQEAAKAATPDPVGYLGTSPERERTGAADKGLSQQSPGILDGSSPAPDSRPHVDDSAALDALKG